MPVPVPGSMLVSGMFPALEASIAERSTAVCDAPFEIVVALSTERLRETAQLIAATTKIAMTITQ